MNLHACLGLGPGNQLLLGTLTPTVGYARSLPAGLMERSTQPAVRVRREGGLRQRRSPEDALALRARVVAALQANECRAEIAMREKIDPAYIAYIVGKMGIGRTRRTRDQVLELVTKAKTLMADNNWSQVRAARELGVSGPYLNVLLSKHP